MAEHEAHPRRMPGRLRRWGVDPVRALTAPVLALVLLAGCAGDGPGADPTTSAPGTDPIPAPPVTYVILSTGRWTGTVEAVDESKGTISFTVRETEESTRETLAGGQVVVHDYVVEDLEIVLDLVGHPCPSGDRTAEHRAAVAAAIPMDAGSRFSAETPEVTIEGTAYLRATGTVAVALGDGCAYGPVAWSAVSP